MNTQCDYRHYQARRGEDLRDSEQSLLAQQANTEAFYRPVLAQFGRRLVTLGQGFRNKLKAPPSRRAYR